MIVSHWVWPVAFPLKYHIDGTRQEKLSILSIVVLIMSDNFNITVSIYNIQDINHIRRTRTELAAAK